MIQKTCNENTKTYQVKVVILILHQVLVTNLQGNVQQLEGRINNQIFEVERLKPVLLLTGIIDKCACFYMTV